MDFGLAANPERSIIGDSWKVGVENMVQIAPVKNEEDYQLLLSVESLICKETPERWHCHFGGIGIDRYFFGDKNDEIYE